MVVDRELAVSIVSSLACSEHFFALTYENIPFEYKYNGNKLCNRFIIKCFIVLSACLCEACAGVGGGAGGIPFEVWCRYYYPNVRDQVIAKVWRALLISSIIW
jgi:hypothetical protein